MFPHAQKRTALPWPNLEHSDSVRIRTMDAHQRDKVTACDLGYTKFKNPDHRQVLASRVQTHNRSATRSQRTHGVPAKVHVFSGLHFCHPRALPIGRWGEPEMRFAPTPDQAPSCALNPVYGAWAKCLAFTSSVPSEYSFHALSPRLPSPVVAFMRTTRKPRASSGAPMTKVHFANSGGPTTSPTRRRWL